MVFTAFDHISTITLFLLHVILIHMFLPVQTDYLHRPHFKASCRKSTYLNNDKIHFPFATASLVGVNEEKKVGMSGEVKLFFLFLH